jgi:hypothetical protein
MGRLRYLALHQTKVTPVGVKRLTILLPRAEIKQ